MLYSRLLRRALRYPPEIAAVNAILCRAFVIGLIVSWTQIAAAEPANVPKGEVTKYTFDQSQIFPGTVRDYWVYVPKQYDPATPACVYVNQDRVQFNAPDVF